MRRVLGSWLALIVLAACAGNPFPLKEFHAAAHGTALEEWRPHARVTEWWYVTGILEDSDGSLYCWQFTIFHGWRGGQVEGYVLHLAVSDLKNKKHFFIEDAALPGGSVYGNEKEIAFNESRIAVTAADGGITAMDLRGRAREFGFSLRARPVKPAVWHGQDGVIVMGHRDKPEERSFYYSFTNMETDGELLLEGKSIPVKGSGWFDRQWGEFTETAWDWFSLRLFDRREIMLFAFPSTGYSEGTLVSPDGAASFIPRFEYERTGAARLSPDGRQYRLGWFVRLPGGEELRITPLLEDQFNPARNTPPYWEGLCEVLSAKGENLGWCVVETTGSAQ